MYMQKGNQLMLSYKRLLAEDKNKIKEKSSVQLAKDIEELFCTRVHMSWSRRINSNEIDTSIKPEGLWAIYSRTIFRDMFHFVSSNEWVKYIGKIEEDDDFLFYDKVEELTHQVFEAMSDTQKYEVLETLFKNSDFKPYLQSSSYFFVCLQAVQQTSPSLAEDFLCKVFDEFIENRDWSKNLSEEEIKCLYSGGRPFDWYEKSSEYAIENFDNGFRNMIFLALNPKETAHFFHSMLERNQDNQHKLDMIMKQFKNILSLMYNTDDESRYWTPRVGDDNSDVAPINLMRLEKKKYNRTLLEFFKYDNSEQLLSKISLIFAKVFALPYDILKKDSNEIALFFKSIAISFIDVGPTQYRGDSCIKCSDYTVDLFKFLMDENRIDALDAICSIENIEEIFPLFKLKGFIFQDYMESRTKQKTANKKITTVETSENENLEENQEKFQF